MRYLVVVEQGIESFGTYAPDFPAASPLATPDRKCPNRSTRPAAPRPLARDQHGPHLDGPLRLLRGFERIENGWWDDRDIHRDYFIAADPQGARLWVYREHGPAGDGEGWFLHGLFS